MLIHVGIDTVKLGGRFFEAHVKDGDKIKVGDTLLTFDDEAISGEGYDTTAVLVVCNSDDYGEIALLGDGKASLGDELLKLNKIE